VYIGAVLTLELHNNYDDKNVTRQFSGSLKCIAEMEHELFPTGYFKLLVTKHSNLWQISMIITKSAFKYTTRK
jgi:hypothetical protein